MGPVVRRPGRQVSVGGVEVGGRTSPAPVDGVSVLCRQRARRRSTELVTAVVDLDTTTDPRLRADLTRWLAELYAEADAGIPLGYFGRCYLGGDFVDHRLLLTGSIAEHYTHHQAPPAPWAVARPVVRSGAYAFVEVYDDGAVIPIRTDGTAVS